MRPGKEKLLLPRFLANPVPGKKDGSPIWPRSEFVTGQIIELSDKDQKGLPIYVCHPYTQDFFWDYLNLFRPLMWFEYRRLEDLPMYVKHRSFGKVYRVTKWVKNGVIYKAEISTGYKKKEYYSPIQLYPASLAEYKKQKEVANGG